MVLPRLARSALAFALAAAALAGCGGEDFDSIEAPPRAPLIRPDTPGNDLMFNFGPSDVVETFGVAGGRFLVHFTKDGPNAVPVADGDGTGVPDFVEEVAGVYEEVLTVYQDDLGFRAPVGDEGLPDNGGDGRFDVYLVDFAGVGDGHYSNDKCGPGNGEICAGYMVQENDYKGYGYPSTLVANRILGSHELFHAVQAAYDTGQGSVLSEGTAVWATETYDPSLKDFEAFLHGYLDNPDRPLDKPLPGVVDPFSYGSAIVFQFLTERYGPDMVRSLWERCENGANGEADPNWFTELGPLLEEEAGVSFGDAMTELATWNLFTGNFADPARSYDSGAGYPYVLMNVVETPFVDDELRVFYASAQYYRLDPAGRSAMTAALIAPEGASEEVDGLRMLLAARSKVAYDPLKEVSDLGAGTETIDTSGKDKLVVIVVSTLTEGDSRKPALCVGTVEEVEACRASLTAATGSGGSGGSGGAGAGGTGGAGDSGGGGSSSEPGDCGCRTAGSASDPRGEGLFAMLAAAVYLRRRRTRVSARASAAE